jgi:hypothetical protein
MKYAFEEPFYREAARRFLFGLAVMVPLALVVESSRHPGGFGNPALQAQLLIDAVIGTPVILFIVILSTIQSRSSRPISRR